jgi:hypothetical protein
MTGLPGNTGKTGRSGKARRTCRAWWRKLYDVLLGQGKNDTTPICARCYIGIAFIGVDKNTAGFDPVDC